MSTRQEIIQTDNAPQAIGPYVQAVKIGDFIYTSGQIPLTPDGQLTAQGIDAQTKQVMENLKAVVAAAGCTLDNVVKTTCFLANMDDFAAFNAVYSEYFNKTGVARSCVEVSRLPKDVLVEVEAIVSAEK
ncbi:RidA family protein [Facilibium subflavum]|uniref:RidA family protein n=1 Tax=Facilibium subflavum TaxID=2219058 RepID=UPI000E654220|nr:RidA family protein [Facilibium subflavum]